jgi:hypothetical protein
MGLLQMGRPNLDVTISIFIICTRPRPPLALMGRVLADLNTGRRIEGLSVQKATIDWPLIVVVLL